MKERCCILGCGNSPFRKVDKDDLFLSYDVSPKHALWLCSSHTKENSGKNEQRIYVEFKFLKIMLSFTGKKPAAPPSLANPQLSLAPIPQSPPPFIPSYRRLEYSSRVNRFKNAKSGKIWTAFEEIHEDKVDTRNWIGLLLDLRCDDLFYGLSKKCTYIDRSLIRSGSLILRFTVCHSRVRFVRFFEDGHFWKCFLECPNCHQICSVCNSDPEPHTASGASGSFRKINMITVAGVLMTGGTYQQYKNLAISIWPSL